MLPLLAQEANSPTFWDGVLRTIDHNGIWIFVGFCVLAGTAKHLVSLILQHNERLAMIKAGINPDDPGQPRIYDDKKHAG